MAPTPATVKLTPGWRRAMRPFHNLLRALYRERFHAGRGLIIGAALGLVFFVNDLRKGAFPSGDFEGVVSYVVDGDTLHMRGIDRPIRLWGVDAPEVSAPGGPAATSQLEKIALGQRLSCQYITIDRYNRIVARCYCMDGAHIDELMIDSRTAREYYRYTGSYYALRRMVRRGDAP